MSANTKGGRYFDHWKKSDLRNWQKANSYDYECGQEIKKLDSFLISTEKRFEFKNDGTESIVYFLSKEYNVSLTEWISKNNTKEKRPFSVMRNWTRQLLEVAHHLFSKNIILSDNRLEHQIYIAYENGKLVLKLRYNMETESNPNKTDFSNTIRSISPIVHKLLTSFPNETKAHKESKKGFLDFFNKATCFNEILANSFLKDIDETFPEDFINLELFLDTSQSDEETLVEEYMQSISDKLSNEGRKIFRKFENVDSLVYKSYVVEELYAHISSLYRKEGPVYQLLEKFDIYDDVKHPGLIPVETLVDNPPKGWLELHDYIFSRMCNIRLTKKLIFKIFPLRNENNLLMSRFEKEFTDRKSIGSGNFGKVHKAKKISDDKYYAVKQIESAFKNKAFNLREAKTLADLEHEGIIRYFNTWYENQANCVHIYIVMQLCDEKTLCDWISENKTKESRPLDTMKNWIKQLAEALSYLHGKGFIHRDVKPKNILFALDNREERRTLKLGDFGLAKQTYNSSSLPANESETRSYHTKNFGTPAYMAPEQISSGNYDEKIDIFALGLVAIELINPLEAPFDLFKDLRNGNRNCLPRTPGTIQFLLSLTCITPADRLTANQVLAHPFFDNEKEKPNFSQTGGRVYLELPPVVQLADY